MSGKKMNIYDEPEFSEGASSVLVLQDSMNTTSLLSPAVVRLSGMFALTAQVH